MLGQYLKRTEILQTDNIFFLSAYWTSCLHTGFQQIKKTLLVYYILIIWELRTGQYLQSPSFHPSIQTCSIHRSLLTFFLSSAFILEFHSNFVTHTSCFTSASICNDWKLYGNSLILVLSTQLIADIFFLWSMCCLSLRSVRLWVLEAKIIIKS